MFLLVSLLDHHCHLGLQASSSMFQGIEKKTAKLQGSEKGVVARHEAGHAVVGTAVANLLSGQPRVEVIIIITFSENFLFFLIYCKLVLFDLCSTG